MGVAGHPETSHAGEPIGGHSLQPDALDAKLFVHRFVNGELLCETPGLPMEILGVRRVGVSKYLRYPLSIRCMVGRNEMVKYGLPSFLWDPSSDLLHLTLHCLLVNPHTCILSQPHLSYMNTS